MAVNAEKVLGVRPSRELAVVGAVAWGSLLNKCLLVPAAVVVAAVAPWLITPLLVCGGLFLCFEGAEKVLHRSAKHSAEDAAARVEQLAQSPADLVAHEKQKIRGAVRTDFILSLEIIVLTLAVVEGSDWLRQLAVLAGISLLMVAGVYGLVAAIVKVDDLGMLLIREARTEMGRAAGRGLLAFAPWLMKALSILGTVAMFLVGGGILLHAIHALETAVVAPIVALGIPEFVVTNGAGGLLGVIVGVLLVTVIGVGQRWFAKG